jgi:hypothetical protein
MGGGNGEILFDSKFHLSIGELIDYYTEEGTFFPKGYIMVGFGIMNSPYHQPSYHLQIKLLE